MSPSLPDLTIPGTFSLVHVLHVRPKTHITERTPTTPRQPSKGDGFVRRADSGSGFGSSLLRRENDSSAALKSTSLFDSPPGGHSSSFFSDPPALAALGGPIGPIGGGHGSGDGISRIQYDDDSYKILVNVADFRPEDIIVKTVGGSVQLEAKREEKTADGHSFSSRDDGVLEDQQMIA